MTESHKFVRLFPLAPNDLPNSISHFDYDENRTEELNHSGQELFETRFVDFTPHEYITALITDLGVLTPSAVSEELIKYGTIENTDGIYIVDLLYNFI